MQTKNRLIRAKVLPTLRLFRSKTAKQTFTLYFAQLIGIPLGIITSMIKTRVLGPENYGILAFYGTVTGFTLLFFRFGFSSSAGLLVAHEDDENEMRRIIGATVIIFLLIGTSYSLFIFGFSFFVDNLFHTNVGYILKWVAIPLIVAPFTFMIGSITQGANKIGTLSFFRITGEVLSVLGLLTLFAFSKLNVVSLIILGLGISIVCKLFIIGSLKPSFDELKLNLNKLWSKNKKYGIHLYFGQIADLSTYQLDGIFISYFVNTTQLGFYGLANTVTSPMVMLSRALSISLFRDFAHLNRIPKKVIYFNFLWLASCAVGIILIGKYIVVLLFSARFLPVASLVIPLAFAAFFQGAYQPYNMFLGAIGRGKWMRNMSFIMSMVNLGGNIILVPLWGAMGACIASVLGNSSFYLSCIFYYKRHIKEAKKC